MKQTAWLLGFFFLVNFSFAQQNGKIKPDLKPGLTLEYEVLAQGQSFPLIMKISVINENELVLDYDIQGGIGKFVNTKANLDKGGYLNWDQPVPGEERRLDDSQTLGMVSRPFLKDIKQTQKGKYDGLDFDKKEIPKGMEIIIGGKEIDAIYVENASGGTKMWILNNDQYPVLLKIEGTAAGIDMIIKDIRS